MTTAAANAPSIPRRHDLDALRAIAMLLGIVLHGVIAYIPLPGGGWPVQDIHQSEAYGVFMSAVHGFRMPLFFLVSGFFTAMLWRKRGLRSLLMHRSKRIFLPFVIGVFTLVPAVWIVSIGAGIAGVGKSATVWDAARSGDVEAVAAHLDGGDDLMNAREPALGMSLISIAAAKNHLPLLEFLADRGTDINQRDRDGDTPLHKAIEMGQLETAAYLVEQEADLSARNRLGPTPLDVADEPWARTLVVASFQGVAPDSVRIRSARAEIIQVIKGEPPIDSPVTASQSKDDLAGLWLLATLFPVFHHLWFLWFLCLLVAPFSFYALLAKNRKAPSWLVVSPLRYAWLIPLTMIPQAMMGIYFPTFGPDTSAGLVPIPQVLFYYVIFFFFGAMYFDGNDQAGQLGRHWRFTLPLALLVVFPFGYELTTGGFGFLDASLLDSGWCRPLSVLTQVLYVWLMSFGLIGMFRDLFSGESKTFRYISDSSYWLYLAHLPLIIVAQALVRTWPIPAFAKLLLVCTVTSALLLLSYQLFVRYTPIGTLLNGPRKRPEAVTDAVLVEPAAAEVAS